MAGTNEYGKKTNAELIEILKSRGLPHSGKKADLIARLQESDKTAVEEAASVAPPSQIPAAPTDAPAAPQKTPATQDDVIDWDDEPLPDTLTEPSTHIDATAATAVDTTAAPSTPEPANVAAPIASAQHLDETTVGSAVAPNPQEPVATPTEETPAEFQSDENFKLGLAASDLEAELAKRRARAEKFGIINETETLLDEQQKKIERAKRFAAASEGNAATQSSGLISNLDRALGEETSKKRGRDRGSTDSFRGRGKRFRGRNGRHGSHGRVTKPSDKGSDGSQQQGPSSQTKKANQADTAAMEKRKARFG
ncbi:DNA-binding SAP [Ascosphaera apis ARSEF 7405]|uniref:DNA-binding SAP n=1 Tax=Ascosphaera apis ARSEF 7405 TaxID=392613 RepID=A0A167W8K6_9EURO|nr:DNA-binding SAP [Ascosphaera apis ARSEF 7405]